MSAGNTQEKPGTERLEAAAKKDRGGSSDGQHALAGPKGALTTHYPDKPSASTRDTGGRRIEGQDRRGYVRNDGGRFSGPVKSGNVAADGTARVKQISGPAMKSGPAKPTPRRRNGGDD